MIFSAVIALIVMLMGLIYVVKWTAWEMNKYVIYACVATPVTLLFSGGVYYLCYANLTHYREIWNMTIESVIFYEEWTEEHETCTRDEDGNEDCSTTYIEHSPYWEARDEYGNEHHISQGDFEKWKGIWQNVTEENLFHIDQTFMSKVAGEGDRWLSYWGGSFETMFPWSEIYVYTNKLRASHTVFDYAEVDEATKNQWPRPVDEGNTSPIISYGVPYSAEDEFYLRRLNAIWGPRYEIHTMLMLFDAQQYPDRSIMETILNAWKGPNKNELVVFLGVAPDKSLVWCDVASWVDDTTIHSLIRQDVLAQGTLDLRAIAEVYRKRIPEHWDRKEFEDFDYISVSIPPISYLWMIFASIIGVVVSILLTENGHSQYCSRFGR